MTYLFKSQLNKERKKKDKVSDTARHGLRDFSEIFCLVLKIMPSAIEYWNSYFGFTCLFTNIYSNICCILPSRYGTQKRIRQTSSAKLEKSVPWFLHPKHCPWSYQIPSRLSNFWIRSGLNSWAEAVPMLTNMTSVWVTESGKTGHWKSQTKALSWWSEVHVKELGFNL